MQEKRHRKKRTDKNIDKNCPEDFTLYGEFIPSFHHWVSFENQRKKSKELGKKIDG